MKRFLLLIFLVFVIVGGWFYFLKQKAKPQNIVSAEITRTNRSVPSNTKANFMASIDAPSATQPTLHASTAIFNATTAQNIEEWKAAIPKLHNDVTLKNNWVMWQSYTNSGFPLEVGATNVGCVKFDSSLINIYTRGDNSKELRRVEIHSVWMNIADTRLLGDSLLRLMGKDEAGFNAWSDKVGNRWMDQPQFSSGNGKLPDSEKTYGFQTWPTFNTEKPWCIVLVITDP